MGRAVPGGRCSSTSHLDDSVPLLPGMEAVGRVRLTQRLLMSKSPSTCWKNAVPNAAIIDSQNVKTSEKGVKGYDGGEKIKGRKRHLIVDTLGLRLNVKVLPANLSDRKGGKQLLTELHEQTPEPQTAPVRGWWVPGAVGGLGEIDHRFHGGGRRTLRFQCPRLLAPSGPRTHRRTDQNPP